MSTRTMPHSLEAERNILGGILLKQAALDDAEPIVRAADFYSPVHGAIYQAMLDLASARKPIDQLTVAEQLRAADKGAILRGVGGEAYFADLMATAFSVENIPYHAKLVRGHSTSRRVIEASSAIAARGFADYLDPDAYVSEAEAEIMAACSTRLDQRRVPLPQALAALRRAVEKRMDEGGVVPGIPTGLTELDTMLTGLKAGVLYVIAGRPSMGKTALMLQAVLYAAMIKRVPGMVFTLEMGGPNLEDGGEVVERLAQMYGRLDSQRFRTGRLTKPEWVSLSRASSDISECPLAFDDQPAEAMTTIRSKARQWRSREAASAPAVIIGIDYLQLIRSGSAREREQEVAANIEAAKNLAKELRAAVIVVSQLNRGVESRTDKRPTLGDLRESGAIEQAADAIVFVYRDDYYNPGTAKDPNPDAGVAELIIAKQRNGPTGTVRTAWSGPSARFDNLATRTGPP